MSTKTKKFWDKQAKRYDSSEKQFDPVYKDIITKTRKYLKLEDNVLDFGCATGTKTIQLANGVKHIHGLDISTEMINEAMKKKYKASSKNISFSQGTIYANNFGKASIDTIIAYGVIHLLEDKEKVIRRINELLKPGGFFISTTACLDDKMAFKNSLLFKASLFMKRLGILPLHLNLFSSDDVKELIDRYNFQIIEAEIIYFGMTSIFIIAKKI